MVCGVPFGTEREERALKQLRAIGVTSVQIYTFWKDFEPLAKGAFDWRHYDRQVELIKKAGLKYVPFILMGPKYASPPWWLASKEHKGLRCLEHGKDSPVESVWNPLFRREVSRVLDAFARHYLPMKVIESVQPGICGDYGEAIFPALGNWPGNYHTHHGYWCGGGDARESFRKWLMAKYRTLDRLNRSWRSRYTQLKKIEPFAQHRAPSRTAFFDMLKWYRNSMTEYSEFWLKECRNYFPRTPVYLCTGGMEEPEHGSLFSAQAKVAAKHGCGIRLTNERNKFYDNFYLTAYTHSACDYYGAYLGLEPVGPATYNGVTARLFGSAAYGNRQLFYYFGNLFPHGKAEAASRFAGKYLHLVEPRKPDPAIAFFWPGDFISWNRSIPENVSNALGFIRKMTNCMPVNEEMILDDVLSRHRLLVIPVGGFTERAVLLKIASWVGKGGTVFCAGRMTDIELEPVTKFDAVFGIVRKSEEAIGHCTHHVVKNRAYPRFSNIEQFHSESSWIGLHPNVVPMASTRPVRNNGNMQLPKVDSVFFKQTGKGTGIFYGARPVQFVDDPEALWNDPFAFRAILQDVIKRYGKTADLTPSDKEIVRARINREMYALKQGKIIKLGKTK